MSNKETLGKTLTVVVGVCLFCSIIVAGSAVGLRDTQQRNAKLDKQTNILDAAGLLGQANGDVETTYEALITEKCVDLSSGDYVECEADYDQYSAAKKPGQGSRPSNDVAKILNRPNVASVYLAKNEDGSSSIILPVNGAGLWDMMYAFVSIEGDFNTVRNVVYYNHKETPGLGGEIQNPKWKALWAGKKLFDDNGDIAIKIVKGGASPDDIHGVDGLSGATLTANGVQHTLDFWLGEEGFGPFLKKLKAGA